ncbi:MAG: amidase domain-containing protein [Oscillospiraceae bacterium]
MDFSREKALAYAHRWAFGRNPEYLAFDRLGGDCTSFVSQCLLAGGAPEDPTPLWGWYYRSGNDKAPAWSGVEPFWRFFTRSDREDGLRGVGMRPGRSAAGRCHPAQLRRAALCALPARCGNGAANSRLRPR